MRRDHIGIWVCAGLLMGSMGRSAAQESEIPVNIRVHSVTVETGTRYQFYLPEGEFHAQVEKAFTYMTTRAAVDYDFLTGDMGIGIGHTVSALPYEPALFVRDDLLFRPLDAQTGEWNRKQGIRLSCRRLLFPKWDLIVELKNERQRSPARAQPGHVLSFTDRTVRVGLSWRRNEHAWIQISIEKGMPFVGGDFAYLLAQFHAYRNIEISWGGYKAHVVLEGNLSDKPSPRYYLGGRSSLIGYDNNAFWGQKRAFVRQRWRWTPWVGALLDRREVRVYDLGTELALDVGNAGGSDDLQRLGRYKVGWGVGLQLRIGVYDISPFRLLLLVAMPLVHNGSPKVYIGLGG